MGSDRFRRLLLPSPHPGGGSLRRLVLSQNNLEPGDVVALAGAGRWLAGLRSLDLNYNEVRVEGATALARSPHLGGLTALGLTVNMDDVAGAGILAPWLERLRLTELHLGWRLRLRDEGLAALAACPGLASIRALQLNDCDIGADGIRQLARSPHVAGLRQLVLLTDSRIEEAGAEALASSPSLGNLALLRVEVSPQGAEALLHEFLDSFT